MSNSDHGGRRGGIQLALPWMCTHCSASFAEDEVRCPRCRLLRPRDGWNDVTSNSDPWLGREFDRRYVATRRVGRGAAASVYEARTPHSHERCALKVIDLSIDPFRDDAERWAEQVRNEVGILARVRSPHVLKFYDVVEIPGPAIAIVTEYIDGESLQDLLDRSGAVVSDRALELVRQTAVGMSEVHRRGAVHRDLKPDNILLQSLHGREDFVHVIDFGIVRIGDDTLRDSGYIGTPLYSSPEQSRGHSIGPQSDIYSLGAVLFHLLTGRPPFEGRTAESLLAQHAFERAPNVARSDPKHEYAPQVIDLVASMLEKEPSARPASMGEVAERISRLSWSADEGVAERDAPEVAIVVEAPLSGEFARPPRNPSGPGGPSPTGGPGAGDMEEVTVPPRALSASGSLVHLGADETVYFRPHWRSPEAEREVWHPTIAVGALSVGSDAIFSGHVDGSILRVDIGSGRIEFVYRNAALAPVTAIDTSRGGRFTAVGSATGRVWVGDLSNPRPTSTYLPSGAPVTVVDVDPVRSTVVVGRVDGSVEVLTGEHDQWELQRRLECDTPPTALTFSPDGFLLAILSDDDQLDMYNLSTGARVGARTGCWFQTQFAFDDPIGSVCIPGCQPGHGLGRCKRLI